MKTKKTALQDSGKIRQKRRMKRAAGSGEKRRMDMDKGTTVRIALGELGISGGKQELFEKIAGIMAKEASEAGAKLLCLPELSSCGYFIRREQLEQAAVLCRQQEEKMAIAARTYGIDLIFGYPEREKDRIYNSCLAVGADGKAVANIRKVNLWKSEKKRFSEGEEFPVFQTCAGKTAVILCYDMEFPEPARIVSMKGAGILFCPAAWSIPAKRRWEIDLSAAALFNLSFAAGANYRDKNCCGDSCVYGPDGRRRTPVREIPVELPEAGKSRVLIFDLNMEEIEEERKKVPYYEDWKGEMYGKMMREVGMKHIK